MSSSPAAEYAPPDFLSLTTAAGLGSAAASFITLAGGGISDLVPVLIWTGRVGRAGRMKVGRCGAGAAGRTNVFPATGLTEGVVLIAELVDTAGGSLPT